MRLSSNQTLKVMFHLKYQTRIICGNNFLLSSVPLGNPPRPNKTRTILKGETRASTVTHDMKNMNDALIQSTLIIYNHFLIICRGIRNEWRPPS